jgi:endonuclease/exonuclease/phosphatase family metal-dependent hydrolase
MGKVCLALGLSGLRIFGYLSDPLLSDREIHRVVGEPSRFERSLPSGLDVRVEDLTIVTWNIERGTAFESILAALRELAPDVVLLQEVDWNCRRTAYRNVAKDLADALQMNWMAAGEFQEIGEGRRRQAAITGQAILSRFPIAGATTIPFEAQDRWRWSINPIQPRRGGRIALKATTGGIAFYNTHIESGDNRGLKRRQMAEILADEARNPPGTPVVIGGDFNNGPLVQAMFDPLHAAKFSDALSDVTHRGPTSLGEPSPIDWLFIKNMTSSNGRVLPIQKASDHFPVMASLAGARALFGR